MARELGLPTCHSRDHAPPLTWLIYHLSLQDYQKYTDQPCTLIGFVCEREEESVCWFSTFCRPQFSWTGQSGCASGRRSLIPKTNCKAVCTFLCCCAPILISLNLTEATEMQQAQLQDMYQSEINQNYPFDVCFPPKQHNRGSWKCCRCLEEKPGTFSFCTFSKLSVKLFTNYTAKPNEI